MSPEDFIVHGPYENVWDALEDDPVERARRKLLSDLSIRLELHIRQMGWTQKEAASHLGVTQPRISDLVRGKLSVLSIDSLVDLLTRAGVRIELHYSKAA